ncbi:MAG: POTRA domain-containing protein [Crocinitomicaceae bacterium]
MKLIKFFFLSLSILLMHQALAQKPTYLSPSKHTIARTVVQGVDHLNHDAIVLISGLTPGKEITVPGDDISQAIKKLWEQDLFSEVEVGYSKIDPVTDEIFLYIKLQDLPKLTQYSFSDNIPRRHVEDLREQLDLYAGRTINESLKRNSSNQIKAFYQDKGFLNVEVNIEEVVDTTAFNSRKFIINIEKGEKVKINHILFYGNEIEKDAEKSFFQNLKQRWVVSDRGLRSSMKDTKKKGILRIFSRSKFNKTAYERDKRAIIDKYNAIGLRDAEIEKDSVYEMDEKHLGIEIWINKGEEYYFGDFEFVGNTKFRSGQLDTLLGIKKGDLYDKTLLEQRLYMSQDGRDITSLYMDRGYLFFNVQAVELNIDENNHINYEIRINEGKQARVKNIYIYGNTKTNDNVILREIRTKPGDLFNRNDIIRTQRELANLGYFDPEQFNVNPIPNPADGTVDIEYYVVEKSSDQIELSGGYGAGRLIGTLGLSFNNFSTKNFFKKGAWQPLPAGDGQRLSIRGQSYGRGYQSYNLSFTEPWLGGKKPTSLTMFMSHSLITNGAQKEDPGFQRTSITSVGSGLGSRLKWPDDYFQIYGEINYQYYDLRNSNFFVFSNGYSNNISLKTVLTRNSIDAPIYPRSGSKFTLTTKATLPYSFFDGYSDNEYQTLSEQQRFKYAEYYKIKFTAEWFVPLSKNKKLVLYPKLGYGFLGAYNTAKGVSPFERFYLGGSGLNGTWQFDGREIISLRGYNGNSTVSPTTGGTLIAKYSLELRYPLSLNPSATIYGLIFAEAGNTYNGFKEFDPFNVKRSAGAGVRVFLPMFGMLGVDFAWGFDPLDPGSAGIGTSDDPGASPKGYSFGFFPIIGMNIGDL